MTTLSEMLDAIDHALAQPRGKRGTVLPVYQPIVKVGDVVVKAKYIGKPGAPLYGLTKRGCRKIRKAIYDAAAADLRTPPRPVEGETWVGTDEVDQ